MTTLHSIPTPAVPANLNLAPLAFPALPMKNNQAVIAQEPKVVAKDAITLNVSYPDSASSGPHCCSPDNSNDNSGSDLELAGISSSDELSASESDIEEIAQVVSQFPGMLEESIVKFTKVERKSWNTANIGAFVQAVLRESYMLQSEQLLDFANKVKHCNLQRKGLREHLAKLREVKTAIGPLSDEQAATTGLNGLSTGQSSRQTQSPTETVEPAELSQDQRIKTQSTIKNIKEHESDTGITTLESRMLTTDGYRQDVIDAIPHMSTQELWHLVHALGGSDFKVADELGSIWEDIVEAMTPEQLVEMSATQATAETMEACNGTNKTSIGIKIPGLDDVISKFTHESPRNLLNDCCELSRVAADRYQTIRDYAGAELEEYGLDAHVGSPGSLLIALEELKLHKESLAKVSSPENESAELNATKISSPSDSAQNHGFIDAVTINEMSPDLIVTGEKINTAAELDDEIDRLEDLLNSVGEDAQMANLNLQNALQKQQQLLQMMSNISKTLHETSMSIIRKIGS